MANSMSPAGVKALELREGRELVAYQDSVGVWTIGVGHTGSVDGVAVHKGMTITQAQCDGLFSADIMLFAAHVDALIKVPVGINQFDALVSVAFNIGVHGFTGSTMLRDLNAKNYSGCADAMLMWEKPPELKKRREGERTQFLTPDTKTSSSPATVAVKPQPATQVTTMNPISAITLIISLAQTFAPLVPEVAGDVQKVVADGTKLIQDLTKLDMKASLADVQAIFADIETDIEVFAKIAKASKGLAII